MLTKKSNKTEYKALLNEASIIIGGPDSKFEPVINAGKWGDECWLKISHKDTIITSQKEIISDGKIELITGDLKHTYYIDNDGKLEHELLYASDPGLSYIEFDLDFSSELSFYYQGELTQDEIAEGCIRPDHIINSYALYYNKFHNQYKTGKFGHIDRSWIRDAKGNFSWLNQEIDPVSKKWRVFPDQDWIKKATFPITIGPTIGYTTIGGSSQSLSNTCRVGLGTAGGINGTLDTVHCYVSSGNGLRTLRGCIYDDNAGAPNNLVATSVATMTAPIVAAWQSTSISGAISANAVYHPGFNNAQAFSVVHYFDGGAPGGTTYDKAMGVDTFEDPWTGGSSRTRFLSAYVTYSEVTTVAPTTLPPTTLPPTTLEPTTLAPTTIVTTAAPTTIVTTLPPTTIEPTQAPTTLAPTTLPPTTLEPTPAPTTLPPTTLPPTTLAPTTLAPTTIVTTAAPTTIVTTLPPTTVAPTTQVKPTIVPTTLPPTTFIGQTTVSPTTIVEPTTLPPTTVPEPTTLLPTSLAPTTVTLTTPVPPDVRRRGYSRCGLSLRPGWR